VLRELRAGYLVTVLAVWAWLFIGYAATAAVIAAVYSVPVDVQGIYGLFRDKPYLASYVEFSAVDGLPLLITLSRREPFASYGIRREGASRSVLYSSFVAMGVVVPRMLSGGVHYGSYGLGPPLNLWYATLGLIAYGPLEAFFVLWLVDNTDRALRVDDGTVTLGLIVTIVAYALAHIILAPTAGLPNAVLVGLEWLLLGIIYKATGNSIGPMIAWSIMNAQVIRLVAGCLF